ncbi:sulfurtransferase [Undibacterium sp. Ren11W]|uniref:sulfurtransferase n=1 Tax=Undibacterium sp. Ren11W TaxID=3413045 RepID=UPI003BF18375
MYTTLISATQLASLSEQANTVILDCRHDLMDASFGQKAYATGHLPGAQFAHLDLHLSGKKLAADGSFNGRHPLPDRDQFIQNLQAWGINNDTQVIAYDAHGGMYAARLWWLLRWVGHAAVAVLDGGLPAWTALGLPLSQSEPQLACGAIQARPSLVSQVSVDQVLANVASSELILVDARSPDRYRGENESIDPVGGHIPGAKNRFFKDNLQVDGSFKSALQLRQEWSTVLTDSNKAIMQCGSGVTACHNLLALEVAGYTGASLYPGSWSQWCAVAERPVALGA